MSLLLDALKRAEQEKLAKQGDRPAEPERVRAVAAAPANETPPLELAPVAGAAPPPPAPPPLPRDSAAAAAAQNVFHAKEAAAAADRSRKGIWLWVALAVLVLALAGAAAYVWLSVASFTPRVAASARPRPAPIGVAPQSPEPAPKLDILMPPPLQPTAAIQPPPVSEERSPASAHARDNTRDAVAELLREAAAPPPAPPVKLAPSTETKPRVAPEVAEGYAALQSGDVSRARALYAAALAADPANIDAQLGAATLEARAGNRMLAASHYRKALESDPRNATAIAGLASLMEPERAEGLESNLRADLARDPRSPQLHYALGNLFASQSRWHEAQAEYFEAHSLDPANADIVFNLAVSLDQLRQPRLAAEYYRRALDAARGGATQFDPASATRRLAEIR